MNVLAVERSEAAARRPGSAEVVLELAKRGVLNNLRVPGALISPIALPAFFILAFSGAFVSVTDLPGFPTDEILSWMVPYAMIQGACFSGMATAFATARDIEGGFYDRLLLSEARRWTLAASAISVAAARALLSFCAMAPLALAAGIDMPAGLFAWLPLLVACLGVGAMSGLWGLGVAYWLRSQRAGVIVQLGVFTVLFLSIGQMPLDLIEGWLARAARLNPMTNVLRFARQGFIGEVTWADSWPALVAIVATTVALASFARRQFRRLSP